MAETRTYPKAGWLYDILGVEISEQLIKQAYKDAKKCRKAHNKSCVITAAKKVSAPDANRSGL